MKIQNLFNLGIIDKDSQGRFVSEGKLIDAENFFVNTLEGSGGGVGKNALGNALKTAYNILGAKTIGHGVNSSTNKVYNFIKGTNHDYIIEYDSETSISAIVAQSTTGTRLNFRTGERITNVDVIVSGEEGETLLAFSGDSNPPRILNIARAKTWGIDGFTEDEISVMKPSPIFAPTITLTTSVDGVQNNFIEEKFIRIASRYKYADGFYSVPSSWSKIAFEPNRFRLDYQTYENKGMINLSNAIDISFKTGLREVVEVELLFKESDSNFIYVVQNFNKEKEGWANNTTQTFQLSKSKIFKILSDSESSRNFDNVPLSCVAQTTIMNRLAYANYVEGRNIDTNISLTAECISTNPYVGTNSTVITDFTDVITYSNVIDFEEGNANGGTSPVQQMNYVTNEVNVSYTGYSAELIVAITPKAGYSTIPYTLTLKNGATVVYIDTGLTGNQTRTYNPATGENIKAYITSALGIIYDCTLYYNIIETFFPQAYKSRYKYYARHQLAFPKITYGENLEGDVILDQISTIDLTGYVFKSGQQIRVDFEMQSSLVLEVKPSTTFFYNITSDYSSVADFVTNSSFKNQLEQVFSTTFKTKDISNAGTIVIDSYIGFLLSFSGNSIIIRNPKVKYTVNEISGAIDTKNEFFLSTETNFITVTENSFSSMHSDRDIEVCQFYMDDKGRKTTSLVSKNNSLHIPAENSTLVNKIKVTLGHNPPSWAKYYKFGIKQVKRGYETIYGIKVYADGIYRWIKIVGENKNKVKEGDTLIVKSDYSGALDYLAKAKVLEISAQTEDFIKGNKLAIGTDLIEQQGLYMKVKQGVFNMNIDQDSFQSFLGFGKRRYARDSFVTTAPLFGIYNGVIFKPTEVKAGSEIRFYVSFKASGSIAFDNPYEVKKTAEKDYLSIMEWWVAEIQNLDSWTTYATANILAWQFDMDGANGKSFSVKSIRNGTASRDIITDIAFDINFAGGLLVFETEAFEDLSSVFFETPETYTITNGLHQANFHTLNDAFNCYAFGNGVESYKIQDSFLGKTFSIDSNPSAVSKEGYKQITRFADITYSGVYNSNSNINKISEFNLALANFKDDIDKTYGPIVKIKGTDSNLEVYQEDKCSKVYYGKDVLYNADGTSNLTAIEAVLGQQEMYGGEYGISYHSESFDEYAFNSYLTDTKRGIVLKKSNNGLFEISSQGMNSYFKKLFRDNVINQIIGEYDQYHDVFVLNIKYNGNQYVTWVYSDKDNGWLGRIRFNPEDMVRINGKFLSFFNGEIYEHNQATGRNTFYGVETPSTWTINFSQEPSMRKNYKTIEIEGTDAWQVGLLTDIDTGYVNASDFNKEEGVFKAHTRLSNTVIDTSLLSVQGIGNCTITGLVLSFGFDLSSDVSIGDDVRNLANQLVGTILSKTPNSLTLNAVANIVSGDFVMLSKPQSANVNSLLGYHLIVTGTLTKNTKTELFAVNSEVVKSFN